MPTTFGKKMVNESNSVMISKGIPSEVHPDLVRERRRATFKKEDLTYLLHGSREIYERKEYLINLFKDDPNINDLKEVHFLSREELFSFMVKNSIYFQRRFEELNITDFREQELIRHEYYPDILYLFTLHYTMFITTIESMGTEEQIKHWLPKARNLEIIGAYAQTELGHGTYIRGLETTATYDKDTEEFVVNSPTMTSAKWWIGILGKNSTHCILMAQLYTQGKCHGIHPFIVQVRSLEDHSPLPGVTLGDIGPKMALNAIDNGFFYADHIRIPRTNLLMKYCQLHKDGTYVSNQNKRLFYGSMMHVRALIIIKVYHILASAVTIAIRYSAIRRQTVLYPRYLLKCGQELCNGVKFYGTVAYLGEDFSMGHSQIGVNLQLPDLLRLYQHSSQIQGEEQILNFQTQQYKLFTVLSNAFAFHFTGHSVCAANEEFFNNINETTEQEFNALHALLAGLKATSTWNSKEGVKVCREACGGHGISMSSGLPQLENLASASCTYEGDNTVMVLQTGRYLLKCGQELSNGVKLYGTVAYLGEDFSMGHSQIGVNLQLPDLLRLYQHSSQIKLMKVFQQFSDKIASGNSFAEVWNMISVDIVKSALAHCQIYPVEKFIACVNDLEETELKSVLTDLCKFYCVHGIIENLGNFTVPGLLTEVQVSELNNAVFSLLTKIRPNAVALVDALAITDRKLDSTLGRYDGQVYKAIYDYALSSPLNKTQVHSSYHKHLQEFLKERQLKANL